MTEILRYVSCNLVFMVLLLVASVFVVFFLALYIKESYI